MTAPTLEEELTQKAEVLVAFKIPDTERVIWEGEQTTWGHLAGNERMMCERNAAGVLEGGYPI